MGGGFAGTVISRRGAEFFGDGFGSAALGRDDLRVVRYRYGIASGHLGGMTSVSSGTDAAFASGHLGGMTSVSSGTDAEEAGITNRRQRILDFYVISKLLAVDTEVDPPQ